MTALKMGQVPVKAEAQEHFHSFLNNNNFLTKSILFNSDLAIHTESLLLPSCGKHFSVTLYRM